MDGRYTNADFARHMARVSRIAVGILGECAQGAWDQDFNRADASVWALRTIGELRETLNHMQKMASNTPRLSDVD